MAGMAWLARCVLESLVWPGKVRRGVAQRGMAGMVRFGVTGFGKARQV